MTKPKKLRDKIVLVGFSPAMKKAINKELDAGLGERTPKRKPRKKAKR